MSTERKVFHTLLGLLVPCLGALTAFFSMFLVLTFGGYEISHPGTVVTMFGRIFGFLAFNGWSIFVLLVLFLIFFSFTVWSTGSIKKIIIGYYIVSFCLGFSLFCYFTAQRLGIGQGSERMVHPCIIDTDNNPYNGCQGYWLVKIMNFL